MHANLARRRFLRGLAAVSAATGCASPAGLTRSAAAPPAAGADLVVRGGTVLTMSDAQPRAEALAIGDGKILAVGSDRELAAYVGSKTHVVDLRGGLATPGLTDAHAHLVGLGKSLHEVDLRDAGSPAEVVARLQAQDRGGRWLTGRGWDQNLWPGGTMPTADVLDAAFPGRPVWLRRVDGHAGWASRAALAQAGIGKDTSSPPGGEVLRAADGTPTGVLVDAAMNLMRLPPTTDDDVRGWIREAQRHALARGLTGVHEMGIGADEDRVYRELADATDDPLVLRVAAYATETWFAGALTERAPDVPQPDSRYALLGVKLYADGALGSRGAALLEPYSDRPAHTGLLQHEPAQLHALASAAMASGWQAAAHAIGDAGNRAVLDAYAAAALAHPRPDHRFRIEHCQLVALTDIARFATAGLVASMQPTHATSDMGWVPDRIGTARLPGAYAWRRFLDAGVPLCFGSDFPVERADVTHGLYAAMTRQDAAGNPSGGWLPDQILDLHEAIAAFSRTAAYAVHRESHLGVLAVGMQADVTCFAQDLMSIAPRDVHHATIAATIVGGTLAYDGG